MASYRPLWESEFWEDQLPPWPCPNCERGNLRLVEKSLHLHRAAESDAIIQAQGFHPDDCFGRFSCMLACERCDTPVGMVGDFQSHEHRDESGISERRALKPLSMVPGSPLMVLPESVPDEAANAMKNAFTSFWGDAGGAANRLRISVERILDAENIPTKGTLNDRITEFGKKYPEMENSLHALRHVGNVGSHEGDIGREELLDAFEVYQEWLREHYGRYRLHIKALADKLVGSKGKY